jgi:hypothetical protein
LIDFSVGLGEGDTPAASAKITFAPFGIDFYLGAGKSACHSFLRCKKLLFGLMTIYWMEQQYLFEIFNI